jgi:hypothetical protein
LAHTLPDPAEDFLKKELGNHLGQLQSFASVEPSLCIWFDPVMTGASATNAPRCGFFAMLADQTGALGGSRASGSAWPNQPFGLIFRLVPRRASTLELAFFQELPENRLGSQLGRVRVPNPLYGRFPQWQPDSSIPAVKAAGDVEVHLNKFALGIEGHQPAQPGDEIPTTYEVSFKSLGQANGAWEISRAETSDATGNHLYESYQLLRGGDQRFWGMLWPDEHAWSLKLAVKHRLPNLSGSSSRKFVPEDYGIHPEELLTFTNVPLLAATATNDLWFTNAAGGTRIVMREYMPEPNGKGSGFSTFDRPKFHADCADGSDGVSVEFLEATSAQGEKLETISKVMMMIGQPAPRAGDYLFTALRSPATNVANVNVTWVAQKTRPVEFLLKPPQH